MNNQARKRIRKRVLERDDHVCQYCEDEATTVDHVIPKSKGGSHREHNLVAACERCNSLKKDLSVEEFRARHFAHGKAVWKLTEEERYAIRRASMERRARKRIAGGHRSKLLEIADAKDKDHFTSSVFRKQAVGMMVDSWEIALAINENATLGITWVGNGISYTGSGSLDGTDPTGQTAYSYVDGAVTVGGSSIGCVKNITISGNNNLNSDDTCIGRTTISDPERGQFMEITGNVEFELEASDVGYLTDFTNGTQKTLVLALTNGSSSITITLTMQWQTGITPKVAGTDKITVTGPYKAYVTSGNTDAQTFSIVAVNADSTP